MKKNKKNSNGFVMSELLAASIVILLLFSILFANYLPLVGEFENRMAYNNVTASYAAFYVRRIYKDVLENTDNPGSGTRKDQLDTALNNSSFYKVYDANDPGQFGLNPNDDQKSQLTDIINRYGIEEIVISKYKTDDIKGRNNPEKKYKRNSGQLYDYIKYLPYYELANYNGKTIETYRLIMKTSYGYATTQILPDPLTPIDCFDLKVRKNKHNELMITNYHEKCGSEVNITPNEITVGTGSDAISGVITAINGINEGNNVNQNTRGAFENKGIKKVYLSSRVTTIGDRAFKDNNIENFSFEHDASGVISIGAEAFSGNKLKKIEITNNINYIGASAFSNNYNLATITLADNSVNEISDSMFELEHPTNNAIELTIPNNITTIHNNAFHNMQFKSIEFNDGIEEIAENAFAFDSDKGSYKNSLSLSIPRTVETIGASAFKDVRLNSLVFENNDGDSTLETIGASAFEMTSNPNNIESITIPINVKTIGASAFSNQGLSNINFATGCQLTNIGDSAFKGNSLSTIYLPINMAASEAKIGKKIFGDNYDLGNQNNTIKTNSSLFGQQETICKLLSGNEDSCQVETVDNRTNKYTFGGNTKYINLID